MKHKQQWYKKELSKKQNCLFTYSKARNYVLFPLHFERVLKIVMTTTCSYSSEVLYRPPRGKLCNNSRACLSWRHKKKDDELLSLDMTVLPRNRPLLWMDLILLNHLGPSLFLKALLIGCLYDIFINNSQLKCRF